MSATEEAFSLVQNLALELSSGDVRLPSLPRVVLQIRNALASAEFDTGQLGAIIRSEPVLAGSILTMANSVMFRRSGPETFDLQVAISRIGTGKVQMLAMRFALRQLRESQDYKAIEDLLEIEWTRSTRVAALAHGVAESSRRVSPDEAMMLGLIHNVGRIYLYSRAGQHPGLAESPPEFDDLVARWHPNVGCAIVESWHLPENVVRAIACQGDDDDAAPAGLLGDVLAVALCLSEFDAEPEPEAVAALAKRRACRTLGLEAATLHGIAGDAVELRAAMGLG